jgi:hypothetical protein
MANTFTATRTRRYAGPVSKSVLRVEGILAIDTTALGGATKGDLPASMFGMTTISACHPIINDDESKIFSGAPAYDGTSLMIGVGASQAVMDLPDDNYFMVIEGNG